MDLNKLPFAYLFCITIGNCISLREVTNYLSLKARQMTPTFDAAVETFSHRFLAREQLELVSQTQPAITTYSLRLLLVTMNGCQQAARGQFPSSE